MNKHRLFTIALIAYLILAIAIIVLPESVITDIGIAGLAVGWLGAVFFPPYFHLTVRWWENFMGQHVMAYSVVIAMALTNTVARVIFPNIPGRVGAGVFLMWLITGVVWWRIAAFRRAQTEGREEDGVVLPTSNRS